MAQKRLSQKSVTRLAPLFSVLALTLASCSSDPGTEGDGDGGDGDLGTGASDGNSDGTGTGGAALGTGGGALGTGGGALGTGGSLVGSGGAVVGSGGAVVGNGGAVVGSGGDEGSGGDFGSGGESAGSGGDVGSGGDEGSGGQAGGDLPPTGANSIAYTGCSMAYNIGTGYKRVGGTRMWNSDGYQTGAMVVQNWTNPDSSSWNLFDQKMDSIGGIDTVKAIMVQICITSQLATDQELRDMVSSAREHVNPGTHIYIVGQPTYNDGHECFIAGDGGADWTDMKAQELANDPTINENMSYLGKFILDDNAGEVSDGCHASPEGEDVLGEQAKDFFGG